MQHCQDSTIEIWICPAQNCKSRSCCRRSQPPVGCALTDAGRSSWHLFQFQYDWFRLELGLVHGAALGTRWPVTTRKSGGAIKWCTGFQLVPQECVEDMSGQALANISTALVRLPAAQQVCLSFLHVFPLHIANLAQ